MISPADETPPIKTIAHPRMFLAFWVVFILTVYTVIAVLSFQKLRDFSDDTLRRQQERVAANGSESPRDLLHPHQSSVSPSEVSVGFYLDHLSGFFIEQMLWEPEFYIWFRWKDPEIHPGETFRILGGRIESREKIEEKLEGDTFYARYFIKASISESFNLSLFPLERHLMTIVIEDSVSSIEKLHYLPDHANTNLGSRVYFPGFAIQDYFLLEKSHRYKSNFGKHPKDPGAVLTQDGAMLVVAIVRQGYGLYVKYFIGLFTATLIAMIAFFIKPIFVDPRFGLGVGGFFGAVANALRSDDFASGAETLNFIDIVNGVGLITIFLSIVESTLSLYLYDMCGEKALSRKLDLVSALIFGFSFFAVVSFLPVLAKTF